MVLCSTPAAMPSGFATGLGSAAYVSAIHNSSYVVLPVSGLSSTLQRDRHPPGKDTAGEPVDDSGKIDEATRYRDVGDVHRPDLIWTRPPNCTPQTAAAQRKWLQPT